MPLNNDFHATLTELLVAYSEGDEIDGLIKSNPYVLTDQFLAPLKRLIRALEAEDGNEQFSALAREIMELLIESRAVGVEEALRNQRRAEELQEHVLDYFMALDDLDSQRAIVEKHPDLLTPAADAMLAQMAESRDDDYGQRQYRKLRTILRDCREHGCDVAFARAAQATEEPSMGTIVGSFLFAKTIEEAKNILSANPRMVSAAETQIDELIQVLSAGEAGDEEKKRVVEDLQAKQELLRSRRERSRLPEASDATRQCQNEVPTESFQGLKEAFLKLGEILSKDEFDFDLLRAFVQDNPVVTSPASREFLQMQQERAETEELKGIWAGFKKMLQIVQESLVPKTLGPLHVVQPGSGPAVESTEHSYAEQVTINCFKCSQPIAADVWMFLDVGEHPNLVKKIAHQSLRKARCTHCGEINVIDSPLVVYRASISPRVLMCPAISSQSVEDQGAFLRLIEIIRKRLGAAWQDDLVNDLLLCKPGQLEEALKRSSTPRRTAMTSEGAAWQAFLWAGTWNEMHEILQGWPAFYAERRRRELRLVVEHAHRAGDGISHQALSQRLTLLDRCNVVGLDAAVLTAMGEAVSKPTASAAGDRSTGGVMMVEVESSEPRVGRDTWDEHWVESPADAIKKIPQEANTQERARLLHEIANEYLRRHSTELPLLEPALWYFRAALKVTQEEDRAARALILLQVVSCYMELRRCGSRVQPDLIIAHLESTERFITREKDPLRWARVQAILATLISERFPLTEADFNRSLACHEKALEVFVEKSKTYECAEIHNNLSFLHGKSNWGDRTENVEMAIAHATQAVNVFHAIPAPQQEALARLNLANSYWEREQLSTGTGGDEAIYHYEEALRSLDATVCSIEVATAHTSLAFVLLEWDRRGRKIDRSIILKHLYTALEILDTHKNRVPLHWADVHVQLGMTFSTAPVDLELAAKHYQCALEVYGETTNPLDWANVHHNLGVIYTNETEAGHTDYADAAALHLNLALRVCTIDLFPAEHRQTQGVLGSLFFILGRWEAAHKAFTNAALAGDRLIGSAYTDYGRRNEVAETTFTSARDAYALAKLGFYSRSIVALENGKTRLLNEALAASEISEAGLPDEERDRLESARNAIRTLEGEEGFGGGAAMGRDPRAIAAKLRRARTDLAKLMVTLRGEYPNVFLVGCDEEALLSLIPQRGALVAPIFTGRGGAMFVIPHGTKAITSDHLHWLDEIDLRAIRHIIMEWMESYNRRLEDPIRWKATILRTGRVLWDAFMGRVADSLELLKLDSGAPVVLFPQGGLAVLPLHAAWSGGDPGRGYFQNRYTLTYAPSGYALRASQTRLRNEHRRCESILAVINPTQDLNFAFVEGAVLKSLFNEQFQDLDHTSATRASVTEAAAGCSYLHFACHGRYDWHTPSSSALVLAKDERLTLGNVLSDFDFNSARLVILSACETGLTDIRRTPDEYLGFPAAFLQAGAPAVVSTLWPVDDLSSALLMFNFYDRLVRKCEPPSEALAKAQRWLAQATHQQLSAFYEPHRSQTPSQPSIPSDIARRQFRQHTMATDQQACPYSHPYYWAAFTFTGC